MIPPTNNWWQGRTEHRFHAEIVKINVRDK